ncbi:putative dehydrogenase [Weissella uvarum]|uniref:oxidoreductase n=1 Tax=Weissella uvarum TaxID=1479233 RepID=UPI00195FEA0B|nr:oxidoreductase [Weissella uvarum]MBM7616982.1 putative dehydrogenase [Weissella uvarum]MCM0595282.1 oxidoreductase [Weissella uvarum]
MLNIAYVGFGKSTNRYHLPYIAQRLDRFNVKTIYARHLGKRPEDEAAWEAKGTTFTENLDDVLNDNSLDLVVVVTPAPSHFEMVKTLLEHGKNVMVDKPMTRTLEEAKTLVGLAKQNNLFVMPFQNRRFDSDFLTLQHVLQTGYVARPIDLEVHMDHYRPNDGGKAGDTMDGDWYGHGVHLVDQMVSLFGRPKFVNYDVRATRILDAPLDDQFEAQLFYDHAFKVTVQATELAAVAYPKWILQGTKGTYIKYNIDQQEYDLKSGIMPGQANFGLDAPQDYGQLVYYNQNHDRIEKTVPTIPGDYGRVYDAVYDTLVNHAEKLVSDEQMLSVIEILEQGLSTDQPHTIKLSD